MYSVTAYFFGKIISEMPTSFIIPTLFSILIYWSLGYSTEYSYQFPVFAGVLICTYMTAGSYGLVIGSLFADK